MDRTLSKEFPHRQTSQTTGEIASAEALPTSGSWNWQVILVVGVFVVLVAGLYHDIVLKMGTQWNNDPDYSHGFLVPVLVGYFMWERWGRLKVVRITPSLWGVAVLAGALLMLVVGSIGAELYLQRSSLIVVIAGLVLLIMGRDALKTLMFPIAFMLFMVPLPAIMVNAVAFPLQLFAARTAEFCLFNFGIPVLREGNVIVLAGTTLEVAEACSGIRSLQALLALGTVYAYFSQRQTWKRWILVLLSVPIAIAANAFRVSGTGVLANYWGSQAAEGFYHTFSGWLIFVVAFLLLLGCGGLLSKIGNGPKRPHKGNIST